MRTSDSSIVEAISRIAETFGRLLVQHLQLVRSELEAEGRSLAEKGRKLSLAVAKAAPFIIAGLMVASLGLAALVGLLLEPVLGRAAMPIAFVLFGVAEAVVAGRWLMKQLPATQSTQQKHEAEVPPGEPASASTQTNQQAIASTQERPPSGPPSSAQPSEKSGENLYGAVGRA